MSAPAREATLAVMKELASEAAAWDSLRLLLQQNDRPSPSSGAASQHSAEAREEAASKLLSNHSHVLRDATNPRQLNIHFKLLTQQALRRVPHADRRLVDRFLRELSARLLGLAPSPHPDGESLEQQREAQGVVGLRRQIGRQQSSELRERCTYVP